MTYPIFKKDDGTFVVDVRTLRDVFVNKWGTWMAQYDVGRTQLDLNDDEYSRLRMLWLQELAVRLKYPWPEGNSEEDEATRKQTIKMITGEE